MNFPAFSVLTKVTSNSYKEQKFYLYKVGDEMLLVLTLDEAQYLAAILGLYPKVFSETEIIPREQSEIKDLETFWGEDGRDLDFAFEEVENDCPGILKGLETTFDFAITGMDQQETIRLTVQDKP